MSKIDKEFGFYPKDLRVSTGSISVRPLPELENRVEEVLSSDTVHNEWIYVPRTQTRDFVSGEVRQLPYSARVFGLPKTHIFEHANATDEAHIEFHLWVLSFFLGMRLTATEAGYLDATPIKPGKLVDFTLVGRSLEKAIDLAEQFWIANFIEPRNAQRIKAAVNALFISQYPQALQFEEFIYLYTAIDACYALTKALHPKAPPQYSERIKWMCGEHGIQAPSWAQSAGGSRAVVPDLRNNALHEALFVDEPLGFAIYGINTGENITLEMNALVCRLLVALLGGNDNNYLGSSVNTCQRYGLSLA